MKAAKAKFKYDVFLSHNSADKERVRRLAERLKDAGLRVWFDEWVIQAGDEIHLAIERGLEDTRTLVLCLSAAALESDWVRLERSTVLFRDPTNRQRRFIPLLLADCELPDALRRYKYLDYRQEAVSVLAELVLACRNRAKPDAWNQSAGTGANSDEQFAASITAHMRTLEVVVRKLTEDQYRVIEQLRGYRRVRIYGCAGSGKTLVAAEKAIRLSVAGVSTLLLCHNPLLAEHIRKLTQGSGVGVLAFGDWVAALTAEPMISRTSLWTNYEEPTQDAVERALDILRSQGTRYQAVIVDEGQDFRREWWSLVEAALEDSQAGILYIFHDDAQTLLPFRSDYPALETHFELSRNCRNAGRVYELMCMMEPALPRPDSELRQLGNTTVRQFGHGTEADILAEAVQWLYAQGGMKSGVVLLGGSATFEDSPFRNAVVPAEKPPEWQREVRAAFRQIAVWLSKLDHGGSNIGVERAEEDLGLLSASPFPSEEDISRVCELADRLEREAYAKKGGSGSRKRLPAGVVRWNKGLGRLELRPPSGGPASAARLPAFFKTRDWCDIIPRVKMVRFRRHSDPSPSDAMPVYFVGAFKGLESDSVLLFTSGRAPLTIHEVYVGVSRARMCVALLADQEVARALPPSLWHQAAQERGRAEGLRRRDAGGLA